MGRKSFFDFVKELCTRNFAGCCDFGSFQGGCFRAAVAMVAVKYGCSLCVDLVFQSTSGEMWRDNERIPSTIKVIVMGEVLRRKSD
jgi:hypothetical protein